MPTIYCEAAPLSVALFNVKELMPKANKVPFMALIVKPTEVVAIGSYNHILVASDRAPLIRSELLDWSMIESVTLLLTLDEMTVMEKVCREADKGTQASISWSPEGITLKAQKTPKGGSIEDVVVTAQNHWDVKNQPVINTYQDLLAIMSEKAVRPYRHSLGRGYFSKFDKVKSHSSDHPLSLAIPDEYSPWFVKCGPTFVGMVAPVNEEKYEENHGPEGLW